MWSRVEEHYVGVAKNLWREEGDKDGREAFVQTHRAGLGLFVPLGILDRAELALTSGEDPTIDDLKALLASPVTELVYAKQIQKLQFLTFISNTKKQLDDLEFHDFDAEEVKHFQTLCHREVRILRENGHETFGWRKVCMDFCTFAVSPKAPNINDEWNWRFKGRAKQIAVNRKLIPRFMYEDLLWPEVGDMEGVPQATEIPKEILQPFINARTIALRVVGDAALTFSQFRDRLAKPENEKCIKRADDSWILDKEFMERGVAAMLNLSGEPVFSACFLPSTRSLKTSIIR